MLGYIFAGMMIISFFCAAFTGKMSDLSSSVLNSAQNAVNLLITLCGSLCLWSGIMEIARQSGITGGITKLLSPAFRKIFPDIRAGSRAFACITMNFSANFLGLGNAATPMGLEAMREMSKECKNGVASDSMLMFVVMNTASVQLIPTMAAALRQSYGSKSPFDILVCVWISSLFSLVVGLVIARVLCGRQKWRL